jgi:hypothetical protein
MNRREFVRTASGLLVPAAAALLLPKKSQAAASWRVGINFRASYAYVSDGADEVFADNATGSITKTTANGNSVTYQYSASLDTRNKDSGVDRRLAGQHWANNPNPITFTVTLPYTGTYNVRMAAGGIEWGGPDYCYLKDNGTTKISIEKELVDSGHFVDATGTDYSTANWPGSNSAVAVTFASTTCQLVLATATKQGLIAHLYLEYVPPAGRRRKVVPYQ